MNNTLAPIKIQQIQNPSSSSFLTEVNHQIKLDLFIKVNLITITQTENHDHHHQHLIKIKIKNLLKGKPIIFVGGGPGIKKDISFKKNLYLCSIGSGKGTQCEKMIEKYGFTHLSAGDLIRAASQDSTTEKGRYFNEAMSQGKLISTVIKIQISKKNLLFIFLISRKIFLD